MSTTAAWSRSPASDMPSWRWVRSRPTRVSHGRSSTRRRSAELVALDPRGRAAAADRGAGGRSPDRYELVTGERRWRAAREAGLERIPAIVRDTADDDLLRDALLENLHRSQLNPLEEAAAYQQLLDDFGCTQEELASRIGRSPSAGQQHLATAPASAAGAAAGRSGGAVRRPRPGAARAGRPRGAWTGSPPRVVAEGLSVGSVEELVAVGQADGPAAQPHPATARRDRPGLVDLADRLSDRLETRVRVETRQGQGQGHHRVRHARRPPADRRPDRPPLTPATTAP